MDGFGIRTIIKSLLAWPALLSLRCSSRKAGLVLLYHDVGDRDGDPQRELVPPISQARLAQQFAYLRRRYRVVELRDLQAATAARRRGEPFPVAVTFDDDLGHHVTRALPVLREADVPATFFLCGSFLEEPREFWWQILQRAIDGGADVAAVVGSGPIRRQGQVMQALSPTMRDSASERIAHLVGPVSQDDLLKSAGARRLPNIGFHTVRHDSLTQLDNEDLHRALSDGRQELAELAGYAIQQIAYPHGDFDSRVVEAARKEGFSIGVTCERQAVTPETDPLAMGRYAPTAGVSMAEFAYELVRTVMTKPSP